MPSGGGQGQPRDRVRRWYDWATSTRVQIDGQADAANERITDALATKDAGQDPGAEGDGDSGQAS
jgi:hypothetical protein